MNEKPIPDGHREPIAGSHTPGPWFLITDVGADFTAIATVPEISEEMDQDHEVLGSSEWLRVELPDLRLMAAAPDLLAAAVAARHALSELIATGDRKVFAAALRALDEAVAKALGAPANYNSATKAAFNSADHMSDDTPRGKSVQRHAKVLAMRRAGQTLQAIANGMGVSPVRVHQMLMKSESREREKRLAVSKPLLLLSTRVQNCLRAEWSSRSNYPARDDPPPAVVRDWLDSGELIEIPNLGKKSVEEVATWLAALGA